MTDPHPSPHPATTGYQVYVFKSLDEANKFMIANSAWKAMSIAAGPVQNSIAILFEGVPLPAK